MIGQFLRGGECLVRIHGICMAVRWLLEQIFVLSFVLGYFSSVRIIDIYHPGIHLLVGICTRRVFIKASTRVACRE